MKCNKNHIEIIYKDSQYCPLCEALDEITELHAKIAILEGRKNERCPECGKYLCKDATHLD